MTTALFICETGSLEVEQVLREMLFEGTTIVSFIPLGTPLEADSEHAHAHNHLFAVSTVADPNATEGAWNYIFEVLRYGDVDFAARVRNSNAPFPLPRAHDGRVQGLGNHVTFSATDVDQLIEGEPLLLRAAPIVPWLHATAATLEQMHLVLKQMPEFNDVMRDETKKLDDLMAAVLKFREHEDLER